MQKTIDVADFQHRFRAVLDEVAQKRVSYVLTEGSRQEAVLVPYEEFLRLEANQTEGILDRVDRLLARMSAQNAHRSEEEVEADVEAARAEVQD